VGKHVKIKGILVLSLALLSLTACQAVATRQVEGSSLQPAPPQVTKPEQRRTLVMRSDIVPDEPAFVPARTAPPAPVKAVPVEEMPVDQPLTDPASELQAPLPQTEPTEVAVDEPATAAPTPLVPEGNDPQAAEGTGTALGFDPAALLKDPAGTLQTTSVAGMPLWLVVVFGVLAIISLVIGFSGPREQDSRDEPAFA
jgi:hypothetical protein